MKSEAWDIKQITHSMFREVFKVPIDHKVLQNRHDTMFHLRSCMEDLLQWRTLNATPWNTPVAFSQWFFSSKS